MESSSPNLRQSALSRKKKLKTEICAIDQDLICIIFAFLDLVQLIWCTAVCKSWCTAINKAKLLQSLCGKQLEVDANSLPSSSLSSGRLLNKQLVHLAMEGHRFSLHKGPVNIFQWKGHSMRVNKCRMEKGLVLTGAGDKVVGLVGSRISIWTRAGTRKFFSSRDGMFTGGLCMRMHPGPVTCLSFNDDQLLIGGSSDGSISISDLSSDQHVSTLMSTHSSGIKTLCMNPSSNLLLTGSTTGNASCWDLRVMKRLWERRVSPNVLYSMDHLKNDTSTIVVGGIDRILRILDQQTGEVLSMRTMDDDGASSVIERRVFSGVLPILLLEMAVHLDKLSQANDYASINELLATVISLLMKFRCTFTTTDLLLLDFKYCVDNFSKQLLEVFKRTASLIDQVVANAPPILKLYMESQRLCCSIFKSLNFQKLPESFKELMVEFKKYLTVMYPVLEDSSVDGFVLDELRAAICENISLYVIKEEGLLLFQGYLSGFVEDVLSLVVSSSSQHGREQLTVTAIKFLITVCKSGHHALFSRDDILQQICESIVIPNVMLQDDEEELFDMDPMEFIKRDMEGSDMNTRRVIACELLKEIGMHYKDKLSEIVKHRVDICCSLFAFDAKGKWKYKDCAIRLLVSLATKNAGETCVQSDLVDVETVFDSLIALELGMSDVASFPILKAGALKFLTLFRNQISKPRVLQILPDLSRLVASPNQVVFSYAAIYLEKLFLVENNKTRTRLSSKDIGPILPTLMSNLFRVFNYPESEENKYVMKCIMRVIKFCDSSPDVASLCIEGLTVILHKVCENPKDSLFIHYLFYSLIGLIIRVGVLSQPPPRGKGTPYKNAISFVSLLENKIYPILQMILDRAISGFFRYAFLLLEELADLERYPLRYPLPDECYSKVFDILVVPDSWTRSAKVPENTFLPKNELSVLAIFDKLVSSLATEDQASI